MLFAGVILLAALGDGGVLAVATVALPVADALS
jgi:hypothetical protein